MESFWGSKNRPARTFVTSKHIRILRAVTWVFIVVNIAVMLPRAFSDSEQVPAHWNFDGTVTRYGSPWEVVIVAVVFAVIVAGILLLSLRPEWFNYATIVTETNAQQVYREGEWLTVWIAIVMGGMQGAIAWTFAFGIDDRFAVIVPFLVLIMVVLGIGIVRQVRL